MKRIFTNKWRTLLFIFLIMVIVIQFIRPEIPVAITTENLGIPTDVENILRNSCFNCHSNESKLSWYDKITPTNWIVASHVARARESINFSDWEKLPSNVQKAKLYYSLNKILANEMPLKSYTLLHKEARITENDIKKIKQYLLSISPSEKPDIQQVVEMNITHNKSLSNGASKKQSQKEISPTENGIDYITGFENWKAISVSDRFDNKTMRVIYGNDIAEKAINENQLNPWPDGSILAKVAWKQLPDSTGIIRTGEFWQVEFMVKDKKKYADTKGWGWARWRTTDLIPYGNNADFTNECIQCHNPVRKNDYVFTVPFKLKTYSNEIE